MRTALASLLLALVVLTSACGDDDGGSVRESGTASESGTGHGPGSGSGSGTGDGAG